MGEDFSFERGAHYTGGLCAQANLQDALDHAAESAGCCSAIR